MTYRGYPDRVALSASERYRLEATSPQNQPDHPWYRFGHQRGFRYRFVDHTTGTTLWERVQEEGEGSPVELLVTDDGLVVVRAHYGSWTEEALLFFDRPGRKRLVIVVTGGPTEAEDDEPRHETAPTTVWRDRHVSMSTAGPHWVGASLPYFASVEGRAFFCWRPWWGRRIVVDLDAMEALDDAGVESLLPHLADREREVARRALEHFTPRVARGDATYLEERQVLGALLTAGEHGLREAIGFARHLELAPSGSRTRCDALGRGWAYGYRRTRAIARRTIRTLGEAPTPGGDVQLFREITIGTYEAAEEHGLAIAPGARDAFSTAQSVTAGTSASEVLARGGAPDWIGSVAAPNEGAGGRRGRAAPLRRELWEYDGPEATARITWSAPASYSRHAFEAPRILESVETVEAQWSSEERLAEAARW